VNSIDPTTKTQPLKKKPALDAKPEKIRAELNIEKWPAIWNPTHSKSHSKQNVQPRTLARETNGIDGTKNPLGSDH
jgi:hypothetical protein